MEVFELHSLVNRNGKTLIEVGGFIVGEVFRSEDGMWNAIVMDKNDELQLKYCSRSCRRACEGLLRQMIYIQYNELIEVE
jgi:hypothetical protein